MQKRNVLENQLAIDFDNVEEPAQVYQFPEGGQRPEQSLDQQLEAIAQSAGGVEAIFRKACYLVDNQLARVSDEVLKSPDKVREVLKARMGHLPHEEFGVLILDNRHREIALKIVARGTVNAATVYPREVIKAILECNGAACIAVHNHPSGVCEPSQADIDLTKTLKKALKMIDVKLLDHFVVGEGKPYSLAQNGDM